MSLVQEFLKKKDEDYQKFIPEAYKLQPEDVARVQYLDLIRTKFQITVAGKCIKPCFKYLQTPVVTEGESECMTNCIAKGLETLAGLESHFGQLD